MYTATLGGGDRKLLLRTPYAAVYAADDKEGSLLYADGNVLMSRGFDPRRLQFSDEAKPITDLIGIFENRPYVSAASNGTIVYEARESPVGTLSLARPRWETPGFPP